MKKVVNLLIIAMAALSVVFTSCEVSSSGGGSASLEAKIMEGYPKYEVSKNSIKLYVESNYTNDESVKFNCFSYGPSEDDNETNEVSQNDIDSEWYLLKKSYKIEIKAPSVSENTDYYYAFAVSRGTDVVALTFKITITPSTSVVAEEPKIITQPVGNTYELGIDIVKALSVEASVSDEGTLSYQWYKDSVAISGATSKTYTPNEASVGSYTYYVIVKNTNEGQTAQTLSSNAVVVFVKTDAETPSITTDIESMNRKLTDTDKSFVLSVVASVGDGGNLTYQWCKNGVDITTDATSGTYSATDVGEYYCVITNTKDNVAGNKTASITSRKVMVTNDTYAETPVIKTQPISQEDIDSLSSVNALSVVASVSNGGILTYQWYDKAGVITGATESSYTPTKEGIYYVKVTNTVSGKTPTTSTSDNATISVKLVNAETPTIKTQPVSASYSSIANADELKVVASVSDCGTLTYQWNLEGNEVNGATSSTYKPTKFGTYTCTVTNTNNSVNGAKTASVASNPASITQSAEVEIAFTTNLASSYTLGSALTIAVTVTPTGTTPSYQWYSTDGNSSNDDPISGATATTYIPTEEGSYYCKVTATCGTKSVEKDSATASVTSGSGSGNVGFDFN